MEISLILANLLNPPVLFFFAGIPRSAWARTLIFLRPCRKFFSLYLLFAIGFKGGVELSLVALTAK